MEVIIIRIIKFFPINIPNIPKVEKWLEEQAKNGLLLVDYKCLIFTFEKSQPRDMKYYIYVSPLMDKGDVFLREFCFIKKLYGIRKSKVNENSLVHIAEIDISKIDNNYKLGALSRNEYYQKYFLKMLILAFVIGILSFALISVQKLMLWLAYLCLFQILRYTALIFILRKQKTCLFKKSNHMH